MIAAAGLTLSLTVVAGTIAMTRWLPPRRAALALLMCSVGTALAGLWAVSTPAIAYLLHVSTDGSLVGWCRGLLAHADVPAWLGLPAVTALAVLSGRGVVRFGELRRFRLDIPAGDLITIIQCGEPIAVTTPGRDGRIILSTGLLRSLSPIERRAVIAHERAHLECRHDRFLMVSQVACALMPIVAPLDRLMTRSLERWADECAAEEIGDRAAVASAIATAATSTVAIPRLASALGRSDVAVRVTALESAAQSSRRFELGGFVTVALASAVTLANLLGAGSQFRHIADVLVHVCLF